jgi:hypothetical protein
MSSPENVFSKTEISYILNREERLKKQREKYAALKQAGGEEYQNLLERNRKSSRDWYQRSKESNPEHHVERNARANTFYKRTKKLLSSPQEINELSEQLQKLEFELREAKHLAREKSRLEKKERATLEFAELKKRIEEKRKAKLTC